MSELDEEVTETLEFFAFSLREDANYNGKVAFVISAEEEEETEYEHLARTVVVGDEVSIEDGVASDATVVRLDRRTFLDVYSGSLNPRSAILAGKIGVDGMRFMEVKRFCSSFDFSTRKWNEFYNERESASFLSSGYDSAQFWESWKSVLIPVAHCSSSNRSMHLSRRVLTQSLIQRVLEAPVPNGAFAPQQSRMRFNSMLSGLQPHFCYMHGPAWRSTGSASRSVDSVGRRILSWFTQRNASPSRPIHSRELFFSP